MLFDNRFEGKNPNSDLLTNIKSYGLIWQLKRGTKMNLNW